MSNDIQISSSSNLPIPSPWSTALVPTQREQSGLHKVHQLLRGRYGVALLLAAMFAAAGAAAGFLLPRPAYQSMGLIEIKPVTPTLENWDHVMPMYNYYVSSVVTKVVSDRYINKAMTDPAWRAHRPNSPAALAEFKKAITAKYVPGTTLIQITYSSDAKDAKEMVQDAVASLVRAYNNENSTSEDDLYYQQKGLWQKYITNNQANANRIQDEIAKLTQTEGEDPQATILTLQR
jgi:hypothetical protein